MLAGAHFTLEALSLLVTYLASQVPHRTPGCFFALGTLNLFVRVLNSTLEALSLLVTYLAWQVCHLALGLLLHAGWRSTCPCRFSTSRRRRVPSW